MSDLRILAINPGSTSTKVAVFDGETAVFNETIEHSSAQLDKFQDLADQMPYRKHAIMERLEQHKILLESIDAFVGRGGGQESMVSGTYEINALAYEHARTYYRAKHPSVLGSQMASDFAKLAGKPAYIVNPPCTDEFIEEARYSGMKGITRTSNTHALNQKEMGLRYAKSIDRDYKELNLVIVHIGGGVSVTAHRQGRMIDSNDCLGASGPFAPTRSGTVPALDLIHLCYTGEYTEKEMYDRVTKTGGMVDYLGTSDVREVLQRIKDGDSFAESIFNTMVYQIEKEIGAMVAALKGNVDAIILTGGISRSEEVVSAITETFRFAAPAIAMPGEFEMEAMASGAIRVLTGQEEAKVYTGEPVWNKADSYELRNVG